MNVFRIIKQWLKAHKYDGLYNADGECACEVNGLCPCGEDMGLCKPGYRVECNCGEHDWHIQARKPRKK